MPTRIRLQRRGRKKRPFYHIVVADGRAPRDGRFIEKLGTYNPMTKPASIELDVDRSLDWLMKGAQPTETARAILKFRGVLYKKHLYRGVSKGAFSQEEADRLWSAFMADKDSKLSARMAATAEEEANRMATIAGAAPAPVEESPVEEVAEAPAEEAVAEETTEATAEEAAPVVEEAAAEEPKAEVSAEEPAATEEAAPEAEAAADSAQEEE